MQRIQGYVRTYQGYQLAPACTVTVFESGTAVLATLYSDDLSSPTPKANPFLSDSSAYWFFYAGGSKRYDVQISGTGITTPYTLVGDVPAGLGDGAVQRSTFAGLPAAGSAAHAGRLAFVTDAQGGLWVDTGAAWIPLLDSGISSVTVAGLPAAGTAGRIRRVTDGVQGLYLDDGAAWNPALAYGFPAATRAGLPAAALSGRVRRVSDDARGLWVDSGSRWFGAAGERANVVEFGATRDGATDDLAAIQAAIDALTSGGEVWFPKGSYAISGPIRVRDGVSLRGRGAAIVAAAGFSGDSMLQTYRRDDNTPGNEDKIAVEDLSFTSPAAPSSTFSLLDLTGARDSLICQVQLTGPGASLNGSAIRLADQNPTTTSAKRCQNNLLLQVRADGWNTFLEASQAVAARADHNTLLGFLANSVRIGVDLTGVVAGTVRLALIQGQLVGDGNAASVAISAGSATLNRLLLLQVDAANFVSGGALAGEVQLNERLAIGASGTTAATALASGGTTAQDFLGSAYLKIASGTAIPAGSSTYLYTLANAPAGATFLPALVSGIPATPITLQASLSSTTLTVTLVAAAAVVLPADLIFRVVQVGA